MKLKLDLNERAKKRRLSLSYNNMIIFAVDAKKEKNDE
jgi:hypothetical protein